MPHYKLLPEEADLIRALRDRIAADRQMPTEPLGFPTTLDNIPPYTEFMREVRQQLLTRVLKLTNGNLSDAAKRLRTARSNIYKMCDRDGTLEILRNGQS